jgi:thiol:disulfide interchange protein DsbD
MRPICLVLLLLVAAPVWAAESPAVRSPRTTASLVTDTDQIEAGKPFQLGLRLRMAPGWHTYWRNPGDAGAPTEIQITVPEGAKAGPIVWPTPVRLPEGPVMTYAYTGELVLPMTLTPGVGPLRIEASANWLVCEKICVPEEGRFSLDLPAGPVAPSAEAPLFAAAAARTPRPSPFAARIAPDGTLSLAGEGLSAATVRDAWFFPAEAGSIDAAAPQQVSVQPGLVQLRLRRGSAEGPLAGVVVLRDQGGQESYFAVDATAGATPTASAPAVPFGRALLFAFIGGLILNLMPCVFPVLAMKAIAIARLSGHERGAVRSHALFYTAGVLLAFATLGALLIALRAGGAAIGWGFQFQSPLFVAAMAWVLLLVGLNLSGVFELGAGLAGIGQELAARRGHAGSFFTGLLAVVVATPCTAPFMGAAIAAAMALPLVLTLAVFVALGLGMAAPYAALAVAPGLAGRLPRPGRWMEVLRGALAFPMYGAAAWLLWVLSVEAGPAGVLAGLIGAVLLAFGAWTLGAAQRASGRFHLLGGGLALAAVLTSAIPLAGLYASPPTPAQDEENAERFSPARLDSLRAEGRPVFVNLTAAWCVTCLVNERVALSPARVRAAFAEHRVAYLKGDWTRGDPSITAFLRAHDHDGVPLYLLYPPSGGEPVVLPQILTEADVLSQLERLGHL